MAKSFSGLNCLIIHYEFQKQQHGADETFSEVLWKFFSSFVLQIFPLPLNIFFPQVLGV